MTGTVIRSIRLIPALERFARHVWSIRRHTAQPG
jgi:hypothetical protein